MLLCINTGAKRSDEKRFKFETDTLYFKTREQMGEMFRDLPHSLSATMDIASQVDLKIEFGKYHLPIFVPEGEESADALFDRLLEEGLRRFYGSGHEAARKRLDYEKEVIRSLGFVSYFLIVWDLIRWARGNGVPVGPGRGSAAGSPTCWRSPRSIRCATICSSSVFSTVSASRCRISTSTSARTAGKRCSTTRGGATAASMSRRS
jgi:DNA polymerase-3 subunit alpha